MQQSVESFSSTVPHSSPLQLSSRGAKHHPPYSLFKIAHLRIKIKKHFRTKRTGQSTLAGSGCEQIVLDLSDVSEHVTRRTEKGEGKNALQLEKGSWKTRSICGVEPIKSSLIKSHNPFFFYILLLLFQPPSSALLVSPSVTPWNGR